MEIKNWLINWFKSKTNIELSEIAKNSNNNYFELKWINSLKFFVLITDIENEFNIFFSNDEFQDRKFATLNGLSEIITVKLNAKSN